MADLSPDPHAPEPPASTPLPAKKFWTGPKIAAAVVAAWLAIMLLGSGGDPAGETLASDEWRSDVPPNPEAAAPDFAGDTTEPQAIPDPEPSAEAEPAAEETGPSAKDMVETEMGNSVVY